MREPLKGTSRQLSAMAQRGEAVKIMNGLYRPSLREQQTTWSRRGGGTRTFVTAAKAFVAEKHAVKSHKLRLRWLGRVS